MRRFKAGPRARLETSTRQRSQPLFFLIQFNFLPFFFSFFSTALKSLALSLLPVEGECAFEWISNRIDIARHLALISTTIQQHNQQHHHQQQQRLVEISMSLCFFQVFVVLDDDWRGGLACTLRNHPTQAYLTSMQPCCTWNKSACFWGNSCLDWLSFVCVFLFLTHTLIPSRSLTAVLHLFFFAAQRSNPRPGVLRSLHSSSKDLEAETTFLWESSLLLLLCCGQAKHRHHHHH